MELHEWSENVVNVENHQFLKENCEFLSVIWVKWEQSVCSITLLYFSTFYSLFLPFFLLEIFKFKYDRQTFCFHFQIRQMPILYFLGIPKISLLNKDKKMIFFHCFDWWEKECYVCWKSLSHNRICINVLRSGKYNPFSNFHYANFPT